MGIYIIVIIIAIFFSAFKYSFGIILAIRNIKFYGNPKVSKLKGPFIVIVFCGFFKQILCYFIFIFQPVANWMRSNNDFINSYCHLSRVRCPICVDYCIRKLIIAKKALSRCIFDFCISVISTVIIITIIIAADDPYITSLNRLLIN